MDPVTHLLTGALIGRALAPQGKPRWILAAAVVGSELPDLDVFFHPGDPLAWIDSHRGFTHSLLGLPVMAFLPAWLMSGLPGAPRFRALAWALGLGVSSHILLDLATSWGTMVLYPSLDRYTWDLLFIVDLWFTSILALGLGFSFYIKNRRRKIAAWSLGLALIYVGLAWGAKNATTTQLRAVSRELGIQASETRLFPQPLNPFLFSAYAMEAERILFLRGGWGPGQKSAVVLPRLWSGEIRETFARDPWAMPGSDSPESPQRGFCAKRKPPLKSRPRTCVLPPRFLAGAIPRDPSTPDSRLAVIIKVKDGQVVDSRMKGGVKD